MLYQPREAAVVVYFHDFGQCGTHEANIAMCRPSRFLWDK